MNIKFILVTTVVTLLELGNFHSQGSRAWAQARANQATPICDRDLSQEISQQLHTPLLNSARVSVVAETITNSGRSLVNIDGDKFFIPASNAKLFTTAAALQLLGKDYRITTSLMSTELPNRQGEIGTLWLVGRGDPSFQSDSSLKLLVKQLVNRGVKKITGGISTLDLLKGSELNSTWEWQDLQAYYGAAPSAFTIDENSLYWTINPTQVGKPVQFSWDKPQLATDWIIQNNAITSKTNSDNSLSIEQPLGKKLLIITGQIPQNAEPELGGSALPDPQAYFLSLLHNELQRQGIGITTRTAPSNIKKPVEELAKVISPALTELVRTTNKDSNNLYAELILRILGNLAHTIEAGDRLQPGLTMINKFLNTYAISPNQISLVDGSGLSRQNLVTPHALVQLLKVMAKQTAFRDSLAIAGKDGTLANRFKDTSAQGKLTAKSGSMSGVAALSGYIKPPDYEELAFSIIINNSDQSGEVLRAQIDAIALLLIRLHKCES